MPNINEFCLQNLALINESQNFLRDPTTSLEK